MKLPVKLPVSFLLGAGILMAVALPAFAMGKIPNMHGAPGPIVGAGFPIFALGYGAYVLFRHYRRTPR